MIPIPLLLAIALTPSSWSSTQWALASFLLIEVVFWIYVRCHVTPRLNTRRSLPLHPPREKSPIEVLLTLFADMKDHYPGERFLCKWFCEVPFEQIKEGNVHEFMAWIEYGLHYEELGESQSAFIHDMADRFLSMLGLTLPPGYNPNIKSCRMTLEDLSFIHRPLFYYLGIRVIQAVGNLVLVCCGFQRMEYQGVVYWYREDPGGSEPSRLPLFFFHGISLGLVSYLQFALALSSRTSLLFESPHISMTWEAFEPPTKQQTLAAIDGICKRHGFNQVIAAGHSFGSIPAGWLATGRPWLVAQCVFVEPVCFLLCFPDVCYNFLYRPPTTIMEFLIYYFVATEVTVNNTLKRHFRWHENICLLEDIHCPVIIALASEDEVAPSQAIRVYVERVRQMTKAEPDPANGGGVKAEQQDVSTTIRLIWWDDASHAQVLMSAEAVREVEQAIRLQEKCLVLASCKGCDGPSNQQQPLPILS